jgi:phosphatidylserine/phosphatidylglycerophosphate/cardiolipin synthase-like enzyme
MKLPSHLGGALDRAAVAQGQSRESRASALLLAKVGVLNHGIAEMARRRLLRELGDAGVLVHYYALGMFHAKAMLIDTAFAYVGSANFDMRSLFLNYENALCVYSPDAIAQIRGFVDG